MDKLVTEAKELGIHFFVMTGGEPMTRKNDILKLAKKHSDCGFMLYTNGTLVDQAFCDGMKECGNIIFSMSIEGDEAATDARRGKGTFAKVMAAMDLLRKNKLPYGTSICYTSANCEAVTSDEFYDFLISRVFCSPGTSTLCQLARIRILHSAQPLNRESICTTGSVQSVDIQAASRSSAWTSRMMDSSSADALPAVKYYCHINPAGDMEPCVFIHYSNANIHDKSLLECLKQPIFREYQANQPFNENHLRPCPMLENPEKIAKIVHASGAHSTDMTDPEDVDELSAKVKPYADAWKPEADKLWAADTNRAK
jgi:sulfatase maturation enzyme AslB (radical SAM superfamily)